MQSVRYRELCFRFVFSPVQMSCAGPEDLPFVVELLVTFYTDSLPHLERILAAAMAFREGKLDAFLWTEGAKPDPAPRSVVRVLKEEAHAVKGSAANLRLYRIAKIAERVEMTPKKLMLDAGVGITGDAGAALLSAEALATLRGMCCMPAHDLCRLVQEFEALVAFVEGGELDAKLRVSRACSCCRGWVSSYAAMELAAFKHALLTMD